MNRTFENCVSTYMEDVARFPVMTRREEREAFRRLEEGDETAREEIIQSNLRFVVKIAMGYQGRGLPLGDLIQEGNMGLLEVIERFDFRLGFRFSTYSAFWIRQSIQQALRKRGSMIHVPLRKARQHDRLRNVVDHQRLTRGSSPTTADLVEALDLDESLIGELMGLHHSVVPLDRSTQDDDDGGSLADTISDENTVDIHEEILHGEMRRHVDNALATLTRREREILELRFGLRDGESRSLREVSREVDLSQEGVRRIERRAFDKLRRNDATMPLTECA